MRAYVRDGRGFIEQCKEVYDIIFLDAFGSDNIPIIWPPVSSLWRSTGLEPQGIAVATSGAAVPISARRGWSARIRKSSSRCTSWTCKARERILIALPRKQLITRDDMTQRARAVSRRSNSDSTWATIVKDG